MFTVNCDPAPSARSVMFAPYVGLRTFNVVGEEEAANDLELPGMIDIPG